MKKITAILLCIVLFALSFSATVFASDETFYLVLGDSIGYGSGIKNSKSACYGKIVADTNGFDYANHAVPGHTTTNLLEMLGTEKVIEDVKKADIISLSIGGNDFLMSDLTGLMFDAMVLKDYSEFDDIGEKFFVNFGKIIDRINELNSDAVVLMQTLYNPQSGHLRAPYQQGADRINSAIYRYGEENPGEIVIVDVATALGDDMENYAVDGVHPSKKGNEKIAELVQSKLCELRLASTNTLVITDEGEDIINGSFAVIVNLYATLFHVLSVVYDTFLNLFGRIPVPYLI